MIERISTFFQQVYSIPLTYSQVNKFFYFLTSVKSPFFTEVLGKKKFIMIERISTFFQQVYSIPLTYSQVNKFFYFFIIYKIIKDSIKKQNPLLLYKLLHLLSWGRDSIKMGYSIESHKRKNIYYQRD